MITKHCRVRPTFKNTFHIAQYIHVYYILLYKLVKPLTFPVHLHSAVIKLFNNAFNAVIINGKWWDYSE
jgi:hypothetical protein